MEVLHGQTHQADFRLGAGANHVSQMLTAAFFISLLPARILAKIVYLVLGFIFWFVVPVICELTPEERRRFVQLAFLVDLDSPYFALQVASAVQG